MYVQDDLPEPILFNPWKHHQDFIIDRTRTLIDGNDLESLSPFLKRIGESTTDLYVGPLGMTEISGITMRVLEKLELKNEELYLRWIRDSDGEYRTEPFPDGSIWVFRTGFEKNRYVHIHPGRNVPLTIRVKATVLKTAIAVNAFSVLKGGNPLDPVNINYIRHEFFRFEPIRFVTLNHELGRMIYHFAVKFGLLE